MSYIVSVLVQFFFPPISINIQFLQKRYVVLSTNDAYAYNLPITTLLWIIETNLIPIVMIWSSLERKALEKLPTMVPLFQLQRKFPIIELIILPIPTEMNSITLSQVGRMFPCLLADELKLKDNDVLIVSDIDIWPTNRFYWDNFSAVSKFNIRSFNYQCCGDFFHKGLNHIHLAMCHIAARVSTWREIINIYGIKYQEMNSKLLGSYIKNLAMQEFNYHNETPQRGDQWWYLDERILSYAIARLTTINTTFHLDGWIVNTGKLRIDRSNKWKLPFDDKQMIEKVQGHVHNDDMKKNLPLFTYLFNRSIYKTPIRTWCNQWLFQHFSSWWNESLYNSYVN